MEDARKQLSCLVAGLALSAVSGPSSAIAQQTVVFALNAPSGHARMLLPGNFCNYPPAVKEAMSKIMTGMHILVAAGDCNDIHALVATGAAVVARAQTVEIVDQYFQPGATVQQYQYLKFCVDAMPTRGDPKSLSAAIRDLNAKRTGLTIGATFPLGVLRTSDHAVFGGLINIIEARGHKLMQLQVTSCLKLGPLPILWLFQQVEPEGASPAKINQDINFQVAQAQSYVDKSIALN